MLTVTILRLYMTPRGALGVCYRIDGQAAASFVPAHVNDMRALRAWLSNSLNAQVNPPSRHLKDVDPVLLQQATNRTHTSSQAKMLELDHTRFEGVKVVGTSGVIASTPSSGESDERWQVSISLARHQTTCTCHFARYNPKSTCKHVGALARLVLKQADIHSKAPLPSNWTRELDPKLRSGWLECTGQRMGFVRLEGTHTSAWVAHSDVMWLDERQDHRWVHVAGLAQRRLEQLGWLAPPAAMQQAA